MSSSSPSSSRKTGNLQDDIDIFFKPIPKRVKLEDPVATYRLANESREQALDAQVTLEEAPIVIPDSPTKAASMRVQGSLTGAHSEPSGLPFVLPADPSELPIYQVRSPTKGDTVLGWVCSQVVFPSYYCIYQLLVCVCIERGFYLSVSCLA